MQPTATLPGGAFRATVERNGVRVPAPIVRRLEAGRRPFVKLTIGTLTRGGRIVLRQGQHRLLLSAGDRARAGVEPGDEVDVRIELDRDPLQIAVPSDLAAALEAAPEALHVFESLPYRRQRWLVRRIEEAGTPELRVGRIERAISRLRI
jgi:hypothetical protein